MCSKLITLKADTSAVYQLYLPIILAQSRLFCTAGVKNVRVNK